MAHEAADAPEATAAVEEAVGPRRVAGSVNCSDVKIVVHKLRECFFRDAH